MKNLTLLLLLSFSLFYNNTFAQHSQKIKSVNLHEIINSIHQEIIEKGYDFNDVLQFRDSVGQIMVNQFQADYQTTTKRMQGTCMTQAQMEYYEKKLTKIQNQIIFFEKETQQLLDKNQLRRSQNILLFTKNKIQEFGAKHQTLIMSTDVILYQNEKNGDITSTLLQHIHQSEGYNDWINSFNETEQLIQVIQKMNIEIEPLFEIKK